MANISSSRSIFCFYAFQYLLTIILLLLGECIVCIIAVFWPHILGIDVRPARLIRALQRSYAVPGREQFTAALDLAQTIVSLSSIEFKRKDIMLTC